MSAKLVFERDGRDWPNREASRFVSAAGLDWHVQVMGSGPPLLLLHGAGASTHSWRDLLPLLARDFQVIAPDLPGHAFTSMPCGSLFTMRGMAGAVTELLKALGVDPQLVVGHSAGCALAIRMVLDGLIAPRAIIGINAALLPFHTVGPLYSGLAKLFALNPVVPWVFAQQARGTCMVQRLLDDTGSRIDARGTALYRRLAESSAHVSGTLRMMANWDLTALRSDLPRLETPVYLITGMKDRTVDPERAHEAKKLMQNCTIVPVGGLGHLAHEESADNFATRIRGLAVQHGVLES